MAMSKTTNTYNRQNWEDSDFPILCETCLGDNPYVRMTKDKFGSECKICMRPFTVFRWCPGARMRFKKSEVCQTCAKLKNVCQTCLLDLEYGLPIQVRDNAIKVKDNLPRNEVNKEYYIQNLESQMQNVDGTEILGEVGKAQAPSDLLMKLARTAPYYKRNRPHICSFWVKGECKRGEECPYRHEKPNDPEDPLSDQNIRDRYYGTNDPVADKLLRRAQAMPTLTAPEDKSITTLYIGNIGNLGEFMTEKDLRDHFYQYGEIRSITIVKQCAFIQYTTRSAAEVAAEKTFNKLIINGRRLTVRWGKSQAKQSNPIEGGTNLMLPSVPGLPSALSSNPMSMGGDMDANFFNIPSTSSSAGGIPLVPFSMFMPPPLPSGPAPGSSSSIMEPAIPGSGPPPIYYPSQDPTRLGAVQLKPAPE